MTLEEIELEIKQIDEKLTAFPENDKKMSNKEWRQQVRLRQEKDALEKVRKAKQNGDSNQEVKQMAHYMLLKDSRKMNPFLSYIMQLKFRSHIWM